MNEKISNFFINTILIIVLIFPYIFILINNMLIFALTCLLILLILYLINKIKLPKIELTTKHILVILFITCLITRLIVVLFLNPRISQISDFNMAFNRSFDLDFSANYYRVFSHWIIYPLINHMFYNVFGNTQLVALVLNSIIISLVPVFLYLIVNKITNSKQTSFIASLLYILWPSSLVYIVIFTPDHYASVLLIIATYLIIKNDFDNKFGIVKAILIGSILALSAFFKNFASIYLIAIIITFVILCIKKKQIIIKQALLVLLIILSFVGTKKIIYHELEQITDNSIGHNISACYINVGLSSKSKGFYNDEVYQEYFDKLEETNYDFNKTNKFIINNLSKDLKSNYKEVIPMLYKKATVNLGKDNTKIIWVENSLNENYAFVKNVLKVSQNITNYYYVLLAICAIIGIYSLRKEKNIKIIFICLCIIGTNLELLLVESQERYRYAIEPMTCIVSSIGLANLFGRVKKYEEISKIN